jgi:hypothetical protein
MYNSIFNITNKFNNTSGLSYNWLGTVYPVVLPEGSYSVDDLNAYLQFVMVENGHFLYNSTTLSNVYYLSFAVNPSVYRITLTATPIPTALPSGYTYPAGATWAYPATPTTPQLTFGETNFNLILGFTSGSYPSVPASVITEINGSQVPQISPITSIFVNCSWINDSRFTERQSVMGSFSPNVGIGSLMTYSPPILISYNIPTNTYRGIMIYLTDQNGLPLVLNDYSQTLITLIVQSRE